MEPDSHFERCYFTGRVSNVPFEPQFGIHQTPYISRASVAMQKTHPLFSELSQRAPETAFFSAFSCLRFNGRITPINHSRSGVANPILSVRLRTTSGIRPLIADRSSTFVVPFANEADRSVGNIRIRPNDDPGRVAGPHERKPMLFRSP